MATQRGSEWGREGARLRVATQTEARRKQVASRANAARRAKETARRERLVSELRLLNEKGDLTEKQVARRTRVMALLNDLDAQLQQRKAINMRWAKERTRREHERVAAEPAE